MRSSALPMSWFVVSWLVILFACGAAFAQDIPGIENCSAEKSMERRTGCLQSNIDYLKRTTAQAALDHQQKLDAANRAILALQAQLKTLQEVVAVLSKAGGGAKDSAKPAPAAASPAPADAKPPAPAAPAK